MSVLAISTNTNAQDKNKNSAAIDLELIELLGGFNDDHSDEMETLDDAIQENEANIMTKTPTTKAPMIKTHDKTHPAGGEK